MRVFMTAAAVFMSLISLGCKMDGDVLAVYKDGNVTRGELNRWLKARHIPVKNALGSVEAQKTHLRQIAVEKLAVKEAQASGIERSEDFKRLTNLFKEDFTAHFYRNSLQEKIDFSEEAAKVSVIKLKVQDYAVENNKTRSLTAQELEAEFGKQMQRAEELIKEIEGGADFKAVAENNSDDFSKKKGGDIGFITKGMREAEFTDAVFAMKGGEITKPPLRMRDGVYIIQVNKRVTVTNKNISSAIDNEKDAERLGKMLRARSAESYVDGLMKAADVSERIADAYLGNKNDLLYKVGEEEFKISDLDDFLSFFSTKVGPVPIVPPDMGTEQKREAVATLFNQRVLCRDGIKNGIEKDPEFKEEWASRYNSILCSFYKNTVLFADTKASPEEVRKEYDEYVKQMSVHGRGGGPNRLMPFSEAKPRIENMLINRQLMEKSREYDDKLIEESGFTVNEDKLEKPKQDNKKEEKEKPKK